MATNEAERQRWNDEAWTAGWPKRERLTSEVTPFVLAAAALRPGERVLDIGCGGGLTSLAAAGAVGPAGAVVGADVSAPLAGLARSRAREAGVANVGFSVVDMQTDAVEGAPFDVAMSQFGVMFFDEPVTAFANIRTQLEPGGRLAFACWRSMAENEWFFGRALAGIVPPPPEPPPGESPTGPFALADPERTAGILEDAGFADVRRTPHELAVDAPADTIVDEAMLGLMGVAAGQLEEARQAIAAHMRRFEVGPGLYRFPLAFQIFAASRP